MTRNAPPPSPPGPSAQADPPELTLRGLRVFVALEETGSIVGAAARIGGSSSGVSQYITGLEHAIGARLFDRRAKPVTLTPAGQLLSTHARRILAVVSEAQTELAEISLTALPELRLAIIDDLDASLAPVLVSGLQKRYPKCFVSAFSGRSDLVIERIAQREADIGVAGVLPADESAFHILPILREPFVLVCAKGALTQGPDLRAQMERLPFVQYSHAVPIGQIVAAHLRRVRQNVTRLYALEATRSVLAMVVHTGGWTLTTPLNLLDGERFLPKLDILPLPFAAVSRTVSLVARAGELGHLPDDLAQDCRRLIRDHIAPRFAAMVPEATGRIEVLEDSA
ncbi:MAG: LysR family transcriptional regulator [Rhodobacteraceae bacterium]|nr:LysR family transcriptional regulator [Paracoccaceae bacterium]MCF8513877.1 LysR family transcriptional regulator [Paracoccaceae bacterium]MCF8518121.1 LysR family transcriptional regulator [Paracoccaceae bacterium]